MAGVCERIGVTQRVQQPGRINCPWAAQRATNVLLMHDQVREDDTGQLANPAPINGELQSADEFHVGRFFASSTKYWLTRSNDCLRTSVPTYFVTDTVSISRCATTSRTRHPWHSDRTNQSSPDSVRRNSTTLGSDHLTQSHELTNPNEIVVCRPRTCLLISTYPR